MIINSPSSKAVELPIPLPQSSFFQQLDGEQIAYIHHPVTNIRSDDGINELKEERSGVVFLPGFQSKMRGTKSQALFDFCRQTSREFTTLDYYGHGESSGGDNGRKGTIGRWTADVLTILDNVTSSSKQILVGSSMGSWIMILAALSRLEHICGLVGIGAAPDFTDLLSEQISANAEFSKQMDELGYCDMPTQYGDGGLYRIYKELLLEGENHSVLTGKENSISFQGHNIPIVLIHGVKDEDISCDFSKQLLNCINCSDKKLVLVENGDHRLSTSNDIEIILNEIKDLL